MPKHEQTNPARHRDAAARSRRSRGSSVSLRRLANCVVITYLTVCVIVSFLQSRLIYFPSRGYEYTPADVGLLYEDLVLETEDGVKIAAWYIGGSGERGSLIFCHGNAGNMADRMVDITTLHHMGFNVLMFDYRGYGGSEGSPTETGTYLDGEAAWNYLTVTRGEEPSRITIFGRSLGGAVAIELATHHQPAALVVESSFTSIVDIGRLHYPLLPINMLVTYRYESIAKVPTILCPKLFVHAKDDTLIPISIGRKLYDAAAHPKRFIETPGGHNSGGYAYNDSYKRQFEAFIDEALRTLSE